VPGRTLPRKIRNFGYLGTTKPAAREAWVIDYVGDAHNKYHGAFAAVVVSVIGVGLSFLH
jgi:hypothetical protein